MSKTYQNNHQQNEASDLLETKGDIAPSRRHRGQRIYIVRETALRVSSKQDLEGRNETGKYSWTRHTTPVPALEKGKDNGIAQATKGGTKYDSKES